MVTGIIQKEGWANEAVIRRWLDTEISRVHDGSSDGENGGSGWFGDLLKREVVEAVRVEARTRISRIST